MTLALLTKTSDRISSYNQLLLILFHNNKEIQYNSILKNKKI